MANYAITNHDVIGPGWDSHVIVASYQRSYDDYNEATYIHDTLAVVSASQRVAADGVVAVDVGVALKTNFPQNYTRSEAETASPTDIAGRAVTFVISHADTVAPVDAPHKISGYTKSNADGVTAADVGLQGDIAWRVENDGISTVETFVRTVTWNRTGADAVNAADAHFFPNLFDQHHTCDDAVTAVDATVESDGYSRVEDDAVVATDAGSEAVAYARAEAEGVVAADAATEADGVSRAGAEVVGTVETFTRTVAFVISHADAAGLADAKVVSVDYQRARADGVVAADAVVETDGFQRGPFADTVGTTDAHVINYTAARAGHSTTRFVTDEATRAVTFNRSVADAATVADTTAAPELSLRERRCYARHVYELPHKPNPSCVIQSRDWSQNTFAGVRGSAVVIFRRGKEEKLNKYVIGQWGAAGKANLAYYVSRGLINFHEDYLGTTRQLSHWQVSTYTEIDAPWVTWVQHKALAGAPVAAESAPTRATVGVVAVEFANLKVKVTFTGGTEPMIKITGWHRDIFATSRGTWTEGDTELVVTNNAEFTLRNAYREVWLQCHTISGAPTGVTVYLSGTGA